MKLVSFGAQGREVPGVVLGSEVLDLGLVRPEWPRSWRGILEAGILGSDAAGFPALHEIEAALAEAVKVRTATPAPGPKAAGGGSGAAGSGIPGGPGPLFHALDSVRLGPPIPDAGKIVAIGLNYRDHALEQKKEPPAAPLLFAKAPTCMIGPHDPIVLPDTSLEDQVDAEAELCVVIGRRARAVAASDAPAYVLGWTIMNDVSGRKAQYGDKQWFRGKSFDTFGPCGPWIVTRDEMPDASGLALESDWGERPIQRGNTRDLIFPPAELIAYISRMMTLLPGDLITTGTPAGVGVYRNPPIFLQRGETVTVRLEGIGEIRNPVA